jgi:hypothetical protein
MTSPLPSPAHDPGGRLDNRGYPMPKLIVALMPALALAACNSSPTVQATNASGEEVAEKMAGSGASGQLVSPGQWEITTRINDISVPGLPPQTAAQMKGAMGKDKSFTDCITPEEAKRPREGMFAGGDKSCRYDNFTMGGGKIDITMHCSGEGMARQMVMTGEYSPNAYHMNVSSSGTAKSGSGAISMQIDMTGKRIGECAADQLKKADAQG